MPKLFGGISQIHEAASLTDNDKALSAIYRLEKLYKILASYGLEKYITFDLGMLGKFQYYTGIIFKAYTYGSGTPIATAAVMTSCFLSSERTHHLSALVFM